MANDINSKNKTRAITTMIGCMLVLVLHTGYSSQFAIHVPYMAQDLGLNVSQIQIAAAVGTLTAFLVSLFVAKPLIRKVTPKYTMLIGSCCCVIQAILHYMSHGLGLIILASVFLGTNMAIGTFMCASLIISEYRAVWGNSFAKILGVTSAFAGIGGAIFTLVGGQTLARMSWQGSYLTMGLLLGGGAVLVNLLLIRKPVADGASAETKATQAADTQKKDADGLTFKEAMRTPSMYLLMVGIFMCTMLYTGTSKYIPTFLNTLGMESTQYAPFSSILLVFAAVMIFISGFLLTKFGIKGFTAITFIGAAIGVALISSYIELRAYWVLIVGLMFLALGSTAPTLSSQLVPGLFGTKDYAAINPVISGAYYLGISVASIILGRVAEAFGSYRAAHIVSICMGILGFICILFALRFSPYAKAKETEKK